MGCLSRKAKIIIGTIVAIAYAIAVAVFAMHGIYPTSVGWATATIHVLVWLRLTTYEPQEVKQSIWGSIPSLFLFVLVCLLASSAAIFFLQLAIRDHQGLAMDSHYLTFIAFVMAAKWCLYIPILIVRSRRWKPETLGEESAGLVNGDSSTSVRCVYAAKAAKEVPYTTSV